MAQRDRKTVGDASLENWEYMCSGGFGLVYKARHKDLGKDVVINLLDGDDGSGTLYAALCREADYMEAADQQYVPRVYGMYRGCPPNMGSKERQGIVMELMEGGSLQSFLITKTKSKPPPWPLAFRLAHQTAVAMDFLHSKNDLVHMDLKPANILLDADFNAKIAYFGLSTVTNSVRSTNHTNKGGTLSYTPPEAFEDTYRRVRSYDVYSYGILLWTILTGESPYPAEPSMVMGWCCGMFHIPRGERPDLRKIDVQEAAGLAELVELMQRCWDPQPDKRPSFAECVEVTRGVFSRHEEGISAACDLLMPHPRPRPGSTDRKAFLRYVCELTLDPNTSHFILSLSENNTKVTHVREDQNYPPHPHRFKTYRQVMCRESLSERGYCEVQCSGYVDVAVAHSDISRQGSDSGFGSNNRSWMLNCDGVAKRYNVYHNKEDTVLPVRPSSSSNRVAVYVDQSAGTLSFYTVSSDTLTHLHTFQCTFTQPLYVGFGLGWGSSVSL